MGSCVQQYELLGLVYGLWLVVLFVFRLVTRCISHWFKIIKNCSISDGNLQQVISQALFE
jgi:hypothetical protein